MRACWRGRNLRFRRTRSRQCSRCSVAGASSFSRIFQRRSLPIRPTPNFCTAQAAQADYIVTGNKRDFPEASYGVTRVVNAGELLDRITLEI